MCWVWSCVCRVVGIRREGLGVYGGGVGWGCCGLGCG